MSTDTVIVATLRGAYRSLPALLVASAALCVAATLPVLAAPGINAVSIALYAALAPPFLAALSAIGNSAAFGDMAGIADWARALRSYAVFGLRQGLIAGVAAELFLAALRVWSNGHPIWVLPSLALTGAAAILALSGLAAVLPLGIARPKLRGARLWITALHLVARRPGRFAAIFSLTGLGLWAAITWSASALLLVPAPAIVVTVAAVWTTAAEATR